MLKSSVFALALAGALGGAAPSLAAMPAGAAPAFAPLAQPAQFFADDEDFVVDGQDYCWYDDGWNGPGWYVCEYGYEDGYGWGGGEGWNGFVTHRYARNGGHHRRHEFRRNEEQDFQAPYPGGRNDGGGFRHDGGGGFRQDGGGGFHHDGGARQEGGGIRHDGGARQEGGGGFRHDGGARQEGGGFQHNGGARQEGGGFHQGGGGGQQNGGGAASPRGYNGPSSGQRNPREGY